MGLLSIRELSIRWGVPYKRLNRWINEAGVGQKVGHGVVLTEDEVKLLSDKLQARAEELEGQRGRPYQLGEAA